MAERKLYWHLTSYCKHNGITVIAPYELRHTCFSVNKDTPAEYVKAIGGHSAAMNTFGTYGHEVNGEKELAPSMIDRKVRSLLRDIEDPTWG